MKAYKVIDVNGDGFGIFFSNSVSGARNEAMYSDGFESSRYIDLRVTREDCLDDKEYLDEYSLLELCIRNGITEYETHDGYMINEDNIDEMIEKGLF